LRLAGRKNVQTVFNYFLGCLADRQNYPAVVIRWFTILLLAVAEIHISAGTVRVATYNLETYLDAPTANRPHVKTDAAKAKIRESILALSPDVLALEEMGTTNALLELRASLKNDGLDFPFWEHVSSFDTNIHIAVLSKLPIVARRPHTNECFLLDGKKFQVKRGFAEVDIQATNNFVFTLFAVHLKSHLTTADADEAEERLGEAKVLRGILDARLTKEPNANFIVAGDFNDTKDSAPLRMILGHGKTKLFDPRPAERNGDAAPGEPPYFEPRNVVWTYYFGKNDTYSRIDYLLFSPALKNRWLAAETFIPKTPNWGIGSDHRPIVAAFTTP
jgi:endonuclease/exonuclease/phosphatase family metal-dependent hydrolase